MRRKRCLRPGRTLEEEGGQLAKSYSQGRCRFIGLDAPGRVRRAATRESALAAWRMLLTGEVYRVCRPLGRKEGMLRKLLSTSRDWEAVLEEVLSPAWHRVRCRWTSMKRDVA